MNWAKLLNTAVIMLYASAGGVRFSRRRSSLHLQFGRSCSHDMRYLLIIALQIIELVSRRVAKNPKAADNEIIVASDDVFTAARRLRSRSVVAFSKTSLGSSS